MQIHSTPSNAENDRRLVRKVAEESGIGSPISYAPVCVQGI
jgi:hypothetical protein